MYCQNCGNQLKDTDRFCSQCGQDVSHHSFHCVNCGHELEENITVCPHCGFTRPIIKKQHIQPRSRKIAGCLGLIFGGIGVHNFYLGYSSKGVIQIALFLSGVMTCGITSMIAVVWGIVEGILILSGSIQMDGDDYPLND